MIVALIGLFILGPPLPRAHAAGEPPSVELVTAPNPGETIPYGYRFEWQGSDTDGFVASYAFAIDPPAVGDTIWITTTATQRYLVFTATDLDLPLPASGPVTFRQPHMFVIKAVDDEGLESARVSRFFFASTVAPEVQITSPAGPGGVVAAGPNVSIEWQGTDADGIFTNRPISYKYRLFGPSDPIPGGFDELWVNPDLVRTLYAPSFMDWTTTSADSNHVEITNLLPDAHYIFCVVGFDVAGAYSARFAHGVNMILVYVDTTPTRPRTWGSLKRMYR